MVGADKMYRCLKLVLLLTIFMTIFAMVAEPIFAEDYELRISGPHSTDEGFHIFSVRNGDPINLELTLSQNIGFWHALGGRWINITVYNTSMNVIWSEYTVTDMWSGIAKPETFYINRSGTYILIANYTNNTEHCLGGTMFFVL